MVIEKIGLELLDYYQMNLPTGSTIVMGQNETPDYDICRIIVGCHRHHSIFLSKETIKRNQYDKDYQKTLVSEVIEKIRLRKTGSIYFRRTQLLNGDEFLYFPVPYELFSISIQSLSLMQTNNSTTTNNSLFLNYCILIKLLFQLLPY